jgi:hypothetical protein
VVRKAPRGEEGGEADVSGLRDVTATRYVTPLREGGSLPGLMEADDLGTYVVKFSGAGQGRKALIAEIICGELARELALPVPEIVTVQIDPILAANEPDEEIQDLIRRSPGRNLGIDYLPGSLDLDTSAFSLDPLLAGQVLWFDALIGNVDRSWRNPNMLFWHHNPYLIDHGAALTFHHTWSNSPSPFNPSEHALLGCSPDLDGADGRLAGLITTAMLTAAVARVPHDWLAGEPGFENADAVGAAYVERLWHRLHTRDEWLPPLHHAVANFDESDRARPRRANRPEWLGGNS